MQDARKEIEGREMEILTALGIDWQARRKHIRCPFPNHDDRNPSWRWDHESRRWFCTCGNGSIFDAVIRMRGGDFKEVVAWCKEVLGNMPQRISTVKGKSAATSKIPRAYAKQLPRAAALMHRTLGQPSAWWPYSGGTKGIFAVVARYDGPNGKEVLPWMPEGQRWIAKRAPNPWPLFRLPELLADTNARVLFVEGEKTVCAAERLFPDWVVTTTSGGCKAHAGTDYAALRGRAVTIWPDNDNPGREYAQAIASHAYEAGAASIRVVAVPRGWPAACDLADELPDSADLREMLEDAPLWQPLQSAIPLNGNGSTYTNGHAPALAAKPKGEDKPIRFKITPLSAIEPILCGQWTIKGLLPAKGLAVIYGPPGCGKSFLALHAALHIAAGREWAQCRVRQAGVIYIAAEGQSGFVNRVHEARRKLGLPADTPFGLITVAPNLGTQKGDAAELIEEIKKQAEAFGWAIALIVIDTLSRTLYGADESKEGMGFFISNCGLIAEAFACLSLAVHHTGKDEALGMRGWSGLHGACDAEWEVSAKNGKHSVFIPKMKDGADGLTWDFDLVTVEIGRDEDGEPVTTCTVDIASAPQQKPQQESVAAPLLRGQKAEFFKAVKWAIEDAGEPMPGAGRTPANVKGVTRDKLRKYVEQLGFFEGKAENARRSMMSRHISALAGDRRLGNWKPWVWII
ncbi:MAG: AAA family ATPase [Rhodomicrobium sp.]